MVKTFSRCRTCFAFLCATKTSTLSGKQPTVQGDMEGKKTHSVPSVEAAPLCTLKELKMH